MPGYEPRSLQALALGFAVGTRGADHNRSGAYEADLSGEIDRFCGGENSVLRAVESEDRAALIDSLILCKFVRGALDDFYADGAELLSAVTGQLFDEAELRSIAQRIDHLRKAYNIREGWRPEDDTLPARFLTEPISSGPARGARLPRARLAKMVRDYNRARGWSDDGMLPPVFVGAIFAELGLAG